MSGEGSSRGVTKRRCGPASRPQDDEPVMEEVVGRNTRRVIEYIEVAVPLRRRCRDMRGCTLLRFVDDSNEYEKLCDLMGSDMLTYKTIDWDMLDVIGQRGRIKELLGPKFRAALCLRERQYKELTLEFLCTFRSKEGNFDQPDAVSFALGRQMYEMTVAEFGVATGFYTEDEVNTAEFNTSLRGAFRNQKPFSLTSPELAVFWERIAVSPFSGSMVASDIRDPVLRYIHKTLSTIASKQNKSTQFTLFSPDPCPTKVVDRIL